MQACADALVQPKAARDRDLAMEIEVSNNGDAGNDVAGQRRRRRPRRFRKHHCSLAWKGNPTCRTNFEAELIKTISINENAN